MASDGYPLDYEKGKKITGIDDVAEDALVFHAGTKGEDGKLYSDGGRVLSVVGAGDTLQDAIKNTYTEVKKIDFENKYFRSDIGTKGLKYIS
jgi:phosphoribosylamine--glycine ligase